MSASTTQARGASTHIDGAIADMALFLVMALSLVMALFLVMALSLVMALPLVVERRFHLPASPR